MVGVGVCGRIESEKLLEDLRRREHRGVATDARRQLNVVSGLECLLSEVGEGHVPILPYIARLRDERLEQTKCSPLSRMRRGVS